MLLIVGGIVAVFLAHRKVAEKITEEEYQRFLDGEVPAMKENGKTYFLEDLFGEDVSDVETFLSDIDGDGVKELHIRNGIYYILKEKRRLSQDNNYACYETVNLINGDKKIENVRVIGPERTYTQVEISKEDASVLGINPPYRNSGDLTGAEEIIIESEKSLIKRKCVILSNRHIHMTKEISKEENFKNDDIVSVKLSDNTIIDNVHIKISIGDYPELHIDTVDSKEYKLFTGDNVEILR